ncbi:MAG TPA: hypothetical protein VGF24_09945 [Vicinamibacterales bacterium]
MLLSARVPVACRVTLLIVLSVTLTMPPVYAQDHAGHGPGGEHSIDQSAPVEESGTAWSPASTTMSGWHRQARDWELMVHGNIFVQFISDFGTEHHGGHQPGSINWIMGMATRPLGSGRLTLRSMISAEPWTIRGCGYPNLLASGEICNGDNIHDLQHPHDLFMDVSAKYDGPLTNRLRWELYGGPAGEPALGPAGFPHRLSAAVNPIAPIAHHWLDSTHITFGLVTAGVYSNRWKAEGSVFNGREPDPVRTNFELAPLDSFSARVSIAPATNLVMQVSGGHLREAEQGVGSQPRTDVTRATASASYYRPRASSGTWATTLAFGVNSGAEIIPTGTFEATTAAALLETSLIVDERQTYFGRAEIVQKPADDLHAHEFGAQVFTIAKLQGGYMRSLTTWAGIATGVGGSVSVSLVPPELAPRYDGRVAPGFSVFVNLQPR